MKQQQVFDKNLAKATAIRTYIQDELRAKYNELKLMFECFTGQKGKVLKHVVDMYHYRDGGYPNENSLPKHFELIEHFAWMVHLFDMIGFKHQYAEVLREFGITLTIDPDYAFTSNTDEDDDDDPIIMPEATDIVVPEALGALQESPELMKFLPKKPKITVAQAVRAFVLACDEIQGQICASSNKIRKELAPEVEDACEIKKGDFTGSVNINYQASTAKATKKKVKQLEKSLKSKTQTGQFNIKTMVEALPEVEKIVDEEDK